MAVFHDEVEIEDFQYDEDLETYFYPCPCGDNFCITKVTAGPRPLPRAGAFRSAVILPPPRSGYLCYFYPVCKSPQI